MPADDSARRALNLLSALDHVSADDPIHTSGVFLSFLRAANADWAIGIARERLDVFPFHDVSVANRRCFEEACLWKVRQLLQEPAEHGEAEEESHLYMPLGDGVREDGRPNGGWRTEVVKWLDDAIVISGAPGREKLIQEVLAVIDNEDESSENENGSSSGEGGDDCSKDGEDGLVEGRPAKKRKLSHEDQSGKPPAVDINLGEGQFLLDEIPVDELLELDDSASLTPLVNHPIPRLHEPSYAAFERHVQRTGTPVLLTNTIDHWPAMRRWRTSRYWLERTHGGRRIVPVELGKNYLHESFGQKMMPFSDFVYFCLLKVHKLILKRENESANTHTAPEQGNKRSAEEQEELKVPSKEEEHHNGVKTRDEEEQVEEEESEPDVGYLAQHDIFKQIPILRGDIAVPDYCYSETSIRQDPDGSAKESSTPPPREPQLNLWLGPCTTESPAHTDPHHNILAQVFGRKYIRLFAPSEAECMYAMPKEYTLGETEGHAGSPPDLEQENGDSSEKKPQINPNQGQEAQVIDMSNSSSVDVAAFLDYQSPSTEIEDEEMKSRRAERWQAKQEQLWQFPLHTNAHYMDVILEPGECLFIPRGWWHFVKALPEKPPKTLSKKQEDLGRTCCGSVSFWWD